MLIEDWYQGRHPAMMEHAQWRLEQGYGAAGRLWGPHREIAGMETEASFNIMTGSEIKLQRRPDGGVDIWLWLFAFGRRQWIRADAKGVWKTPKFLLVPTQDLVIQEEWQRFDPVNGRRQSGAVRPMTIYIQGYRPPGQGEDENEIGPWPMNGWMWGHRVMTYPAEWFNNQNKYVHVVPSLGAESHLRPMSELMAMYCDRWRHPFGEQQQANYCEDVILRGGYGRRITKEIRDVQRTTQPGLFDRLAAPAAAGWRIPVV